MAKERRQLNKEELKALESRAFLSAGMMPGTVKEDDRSVDCIFYTGADVQRYSWSDGGYMLHFDPKGADLSQLNNGAPVLDSHSDWGCSNVMGTVTKAWESGGKYYASLRFRRSTEETGPRPECDGTWQDIKDGILSKFSMGVEFLEMSEQRDGAGKLLGKTALKWRPFEISLLPVPADFGTTTLAAEAPPTDAVRATSLKEQQLMADKPINNTGDLARTPEVTPPPAQTSDEQLNSARQVGVTSELARVETILGVCEKLRLPNSFSRRHIKEGTALETFHKLAIDERARISAQETADVGHVRTLHPEILSDEADSRRRNMAAALLERYAPGMWLFDERDGFRFHKAGGQRAYDGGRSYSSCTLLDIAKECLTAQGIRWQSKSRTEIAQLAFQSTSDFPYILADVAGKSLRAGYEMVESQWRLIASRRSAADFKTQKELTLDGSASLEKVPESGEFKRGKLVEGKETYALSTYGKIISITRQAIINDDLGAFTRTPQLLGQEVGMLEGDTVWGIVTTNGNLADGTALFAASALRGADATGNLVTGAGTVISIENIGIVRVKMMRQQSPGGKTLGVNPRYLVAPATKAMVAEQYTSSAYQATTAATVNNMAGKLQPIIEARLDATSTTAWYLFADPNTPNGTVLIYAYLEGQEGPYTETRNGFDVDGVEIKIRHDFAAAAVDFRGAAKNDGA